MNPGQAPVTHTTKVPSFVYQDRSVFSFYGFHSLSEYAVTKTENPFSRKSTNLTIG